MHKGLWHIWDTGPNSAAKNMQHDRDLLAALKADDKPVIHLYSWIGECATCGYFTRYESLLNLQAAEELGLDIAVRPTGGGIVFHKADLAFSLLVPANLPFCSPNTLQNYAFVNQCVAEALRIFDHKVELLPATPCSLDEASGHFCMAQPTIYDVIVNGRKVGGAAQRRTKNGYLHQGTISLGQLPRSYLARLLRPGTRVLEAMEKNGFFLLPPNWTEAQLEEARAHLREALILALHRQCP